MIERLSPQDKILDFFAENPKPDLIFYENMDADVAKDMVRARASMIMKRLDFIRSVDPFVYRDSESTVKTRQHLEDLRRRTFAGETGFADQINLDENSIEEIDKSYSQGGTNSEWGLVFKATVEEMLELNRIFIDQ